MLVGSRDLLFVKSGRDVNNTAICSASNSLETVTECRKDASPHSVGFGLTTWCFLRSSQRHGGKS